MLCALPFDNAFAPAAVRLLEWCAELHGQSRHECLLVACNDTRPEVLNGVYSRAIGAFSSVKAVKPTQGDQHKWPETVNLLFRTAVKWVEKYGKQPFYWLEVDCVPLVPTWLDDLEWEYNGAGKPYMGFRRDVPCPHISGPAIYPANVSKLNPESLASKSNKHGGIPFDLVDGLKTLKHAHVTKLIHHVWGENETNIPWTFPDREAVGRINKEAVLFHRDKSGSLIERLREMKPKTEVTQNGEVQWTPLENPQVVVVYVYPVFGGNHDILAQRFAESYRKFTPTMPHELVIVSNGGHPTPAMQSTFRGIAHRFLVHDDTGWDIGAYRKAAKEVPCDLMVFFGGSTYLRGACWLERMVDAFEDHGPALYGAMGSLGVRMHIRTSGWFCQPELLNSYPNHITSDRESRYGFEHGPQSITQWAIKKGLRPLVVTWDAVYDCRDCDKIPDGFHKNNQSGLIVGDRLTRPPFHPHE